MKPKIIYAAFFMAFASFFLAACGSKEKSLIYTTESVLYLNVEPFGQSGADLASLPDNEKMKSVRIIILHADGTVEHNRHYVSDVADERRYILLKVAPHEHKKIFLFANEESVSAVEGAGMENTSLTGFFENYPEGSSGFEKAVNDIYFTPDYSNGKPIPMSSVYEMDFTEGNVVKVFHVVRIATKFIVNFMNWRGEEVEIDSFTIARYADKNFLMAHVGDYPQSDVYPTWIDWLKAVSDASSGNDDSATTDAAGWLNDYELPAHEELVYKYGKVVVGKPAVDMANPDNSKPGKAKNIPVFYLPESMNFKAGATDGEQEYTMTVSVNGKAEPFVFKLPNLKALFRNTNVVVNITLYNSNEIVDVIPYSEITLEPVFGL